MKEETVTLLIEHLLAVAQRLRREERGSQVIEWMALGALGVVAIVAINAALTRLGLDIVVWARGQLGI
jgi:Flp pilus assembly pilin Flp